MKKYFIILVAVFICIFSFGCQQESQIKNYSIEEIETCLKEAKYNIDNEYDGLYDSGDKVLQIWLSVEDKTETSIYIISYKDEEYAKKICKQVEDDGFQKYIRKGNVVAIYSKDMSSNIEDILESILNCKPIDYESVILKLK